MSSNLKYTGANIATSYYPSGQAPLDVRSIVDSFSNIKNSLNAFKTSTGDDTSYIGMMVTAYDSGNVYVLTSKNPITWKEIGSDLSKLSGVFTFKGLAEAISPDLSYIVVCTPSIDGMEVSPIGTFTDLEGEIYYGWENKNGDIFYTDSLVLNDLTKQYEKGSDTYEMRSLEYNGDMYYLTTASPIADDDVQAYENVSGEVIYLGSGYMGFSNGFQVYVMDQEGAVLGTAIGHVYNAYEFTVVIDPIQITHSHVIIYASDGTKVVDGTTISDNSGHVYQIGENEYASNGQIWVKLGSPVEDWIIL